jgi:hypothetical protein
MSQQSGERVTKVASLDMLTFSRLDAVEVISY